VVGESSSAGSVRDSNANWFSHPLHTGRGCAAPAQPRAGAPPWVGRGPPSTPRRRGRRRLRARVPPSGKPLGTRGPPPCRAPLSGGPHAPPPVRSRRHGRRRVDRRRHTARCAGRRVHGADGRPVNGQTPAARVMGDYRGGGGGGPGGVHANHWHDGATGGRDARGDHWACGRKTSGVWTGLRARTVKHVSLMVVLDAEHGIGRLPIVGVRPRATVWRAAARHGAP